MPMPNFNQWRLFQTINGWATRGAHHNHVQHPGSSSDTPRHSLRRIKARCAWLRWFAAVITDLFEPSIWIGASSSLVELLHFMSYNGPLKFLELWSRTTSPRKNMLSASSPSILNNRKQTPWTILNLGLSFQRIGGTKFGIDPHLSLLRCMKNA